MRDLGEIYPKSSFIITKMFWKLVSNTIHYIVFEYEYKAYTNKTMVYFLVRMTRNQSLSKTLIHESRKKEKAAK